MATSSIVTEGVSSSTSLASELYCSLNLHFIIDFKTRLPKFNWPTDVACSRAFEMLRFVDLQRARCGLAGRFLAPMSLSGSRTLAFRFKTWRSIFHVANLTRTAVIMCAILKVTQLCAYILHAVNVAFDTLFPSFIMYSWWNHMLTNEMSWAPIDCVQNAQFW